MEITLNTSGFGFHSTMDMSFDTPGVIKSELVQTPTAKMQIQKHLDKIKEVFLSSDYDDDTMGYIVEDHIIAIQEILDANGF